MSFVPFFDFPYFVWLVELDVLLVSVCSSRRWLFLCADIVWFEMDGVG